MPHPLHLCRVARRRAALALVVVALGAVTACSGGSQEVTVPSVSSTTAALGTGTTVASTPLAAGQAYSRCMRSNGVPAWPDPEATPNGSYGYRTVGVDPDSPGFAAAGEACKALLPDWFSGGEDLTPAQQQAWLAWAQCVRGHGAPGFADPTFPGGGAVALSDGSRSPSPQVQAAMDACRSRMPATGGIGG